MYRQPAFAMTDACAPATAFRLPAPRIAEVTKLDVKVVDGKVTQFRTRLSLSFKYGA